MSLNQINFKKWLSILSLTGLTISLPLVSFAVGQTAAVQSLPKLLLISDIDDTIKVSHVLNKADAASRAADVTTPFTGMAQLYQWVSNSHTNTQIVYLSNAPEEVAGIPAFKISHQTFLNYNHFPKGELDLREDIFDQNFKITEIRRLLKSEKPDIVIFVGDNGERDAEIYHQATIEFAQSGIQFHTFIHQLYSKEKSFFKPDFLEELGHSIFPEQHGFVTPIEVALQLRDDSLISSAGLQWMLQNVAPYISQEKDFKWDGLKQITFPFFSNCADFEWATKRSEGGLESSESKLLEQLKQKIEKECHP